MEFDGIGGRKRSAPTAAVPHSPTSHLSLHINTGNDVLPATSRPAINTPPGGTPNQDLLPGFGMSAALPGVCALGQIASGTVFAFLFGSVGFVLHGDPGVRSLPWLAGVVFGASIASVAARGATESDDMNSEARRRMLFGVVAAMVGALLSGVMVATLMPRVYYDHLLACAIVSVGSWLAQELQGSRSVQVQVGLARQRVQAALALRK